MELLSNFETGVRTALKFSIVCLLVIMEPVDFETVPMMLALIF
jgi:hypothetical protein